MSLILVEKERKGVSVEKMKLQGGWSGHTGIVTFEDVEVPFENLIGLEGKGFGTIMKNFNHERFVIAIAAVRQVLRFKVMLCKIFFNFMFTNDLFPLKEK